MTRVLGVGLLTGWGEGVAALPPEARGAAGDRRVVPAATPAITGERFRRATRECLLGVAAVEAALRDSGLERSTVAGPRTALVYATAAAYGASNRAFIVATSGSPARTEGGPSGDARGSVVATSGSPARTEGGLTRDARGSVVAMSGSPARTEGGLTGDARGFVVATSGSPARTEGGLTGDARGSVVAMSGSPARTEGGLTRDARGSVRTGVYFPYTAPSSVPAEVAIEYGLTGGYVILVGGPVAGVDALWQASTLLAAGRADLALVLAVETFEECAELWSRGRWTTPRPLVEAAACAVLAGDGGKPGYGAADGASTLETLASRRAGETLACAPLVALALARAAGTPRARVTGRWRGRSAQIALAT